MSEHVRRGRRPTPSARAKWIAVGFLFLVAACGSGNGNASHIVDGSNAPTRIRVGWQIPWATQGQVVESLRRTDILQRNGLEASFKGFTFGAPLNEAALAHEVDAVFTADQPAATLLSRDGAFTIVARLMYNRVAIYVPPQSRITSVRDLAGKRIGMPFGAAAQRDALRAIAQAGLDPRKDVEPVNLDILEQAAIVRAGNRQSWRGVDALVGFDPTPAVFEAEGLARMLHVGRVVAVVMLSNSYMTTANVDAAKRFLRAYAEAWYYYVSHQKQANAWFKEDSGLVFAGDLPLEIAASVEPNIHARRPADLDLILSESDIATLQEAADFTADQELVSKRVNMRDHIDQHLMAQVSREVQSYRPSGVRLR